MRPMRIFARSLTSTIVFVFSGLRRMFAYFILRSSEIELDGKRKALEQVTDPIARSLMCASILVAERECEDALRHYNALLPVGQRRFLHVSNL